MIDSLYSCNDFAMWSAVECDGEGYGKTTGSRECCTDTRPVHPHRARSDEKLSINGHAAVDESQGWCLRDGDVGRFPASIPEGATPPA